MRAQVYGTPFAISQVYARLYLLLYPTFAYLILHCLTFTYIVLHILLYLTYLTL